MLSVRSDTVFALHQPVDFTCCPLTVFQNQNRRIVARRIANASGKGVEKKRIVEKITLYIRYAVCVYNDTVVRVREHTRARA